MDCFWLGTHQAHWLRQTAVPLFVSARRLRRRKKVPMSVGPWALDSGGFTELSKHGRWTIPPEQYADEARRWREQVGGMAWASIQDWMCEPDILHGNAEKGWPGTHLSVSEHQRRTIDNYLTLQRLAPDLPWVPVLQGWEIDEYLSHLEQYAAAGVNLASLPLVGLGSVCRRQNTSMAEELIRVLAARGVRLHAFGFKTLGLPRVARHLVSADSMAWSYGGRRGDRGPDCTHKGKCAHCLPFALHWRERVLAKIAQRAGQPLQGRLYDLMR